MITLGGDARSSNGFKRPSPSVINAGSPISKARMENPFTGGVFENSIVPTESRSSKARVENTLNAGLGISEKFSLIEIRESLRCCSNGKEFVKSGQRDLQGRINATKLVAARCRKLKKRFADQQLSLRLSIRNASSIFALLLNLIFYNTTSEEERCQKKQIVSEVLLRLLDCVVDIPLLARDALVSLFDSIEDLELLALANLVALDLQLPKVLQQTVAGILESSETGPASEKIQLFSVSLIMGKAIAAIPKELTKLLIYSCGALVKNQPELHLPALLCIQAYLNHSRVVTGSLPSDFPSGRDIIERFTQKILKHRPTYLNRECLRLLLTASSPLYADLLRELFKDEKNVCDILLATAVKFPSEMFEVLGRVYSLSPAESLPLETLSAVVETVSASRGPEVIDTVVKFCLSCSEADLLIRSFFGCPDEEEVGSEKLSKVTPLIEELQNRKLNDDLAVLWPACALRFLDHAVIREALSDGSLQRFVNEASGKEEEVPAMLLLCPNLKFLRMPLERLVLKCELDTSTKSCANCEVLKTKIQGSEAGKDAMAHLVGALKFKIKTLEDERTKMNVKVNQSDNLVNQRKAEVTSIQAQVASIQTQISARDQKIEELERAAEKAAAELSDQCNKNQETMTVLKQARRETEKVRGEFERKRGECQTLQRELSACKEQLAAARMKIEELETFKEKLSSLMGSFSK